MKKQLSTYPLRLPGSLKAAVAEVSRADGTSINRFVTTAVAEKLSALKIAEFFADRAAGADIKAARRPGHADFRGVLSGRPAPPASDRCTTHRPAPGVDVW